MKGGRRPSRDKTSVKVTHKEYKEPKENNRDNYRDHEPGYEELRTIAENRFKKKLQENKESRAASLNDVLSILKGIRYITEKVAST